MPATATADHRHSRQDKLPNGIEPVLQISALPAELLRIEQGAVADDADPQQALDATVRSVGSLDTVRGVEVALWDGAKFACIATHGSPGLEDREKQGELYAQCMDTGRMLRGDGTVGQAAGAPCSSALLMPMFTRGGAIGVFATFSDGVGIFSNDYILPLATAAAICSALAIRIQETDRAVSDLTAGTREPVADIQAGEPEIPQVAPDRLDLVCRARPAKLKSAPTKTAPAGRQGSSGNTNVWGEDRDHGAPDLGNKEDLRSVLLQGQPPRPETEPAPPPPNARTWNLVLVVLVVLALSGLVFGIVKVVG